MISAVNSADAGGGAVVIAALLLLFLAFHVVASAAAQLWAGRRCLRGKGAREWDAWLEVLRAGAAGPVQALVARVTIPLCRRLWPPTAPEVPEVAQVREVSGGSGGNAAPPRRS